MKPNLSDWLLDVHRDARGVATGNAFCTRVLERLTRLIAFDVALFMRGAIIGTDAQLHAQHLAGQSQDMLAEFFAQELWRVDPLMARVLGAPGVACRIGIDEYTSAELREFLDRWGQRQLIGVAIFEPELQLFAGLALYRRDAAHPFADDESATFECVVPHIVDGWTQSWLFELMRSPKELDTPFAFAVLTPERTLTVAQREFYPHLTLEWPGWRGPVLPAPLDEHVRQRSGTPWIGQKVVLYFEEMIGAGYLVRLRERHALDRLSPRKLCVAREFARGASQGQVAARLHLSPSTVNNYLVDIYRELDVFDKVQLARLVSRLDPTGTSANTTQ